MAVSDDDETFERDQQMDNDDILENTQGAIHSSATKLIKKEGSKQVSSKQTSSKPGNSK